MKWMQYYFVTSGPKGICAAAVRQFPAFFRGSEKANLQRASRYWRNRAQILSQHFTNTKHNGHYFVRPTLLGLKSHAVKAAPGRGRHKTAWSQSLSAALLEDFDRFRKAGVKINSRLLRMMAHKLIADGGNTDYASFVRDPRSGKPILAHVTKRWVQHFMQTNNIISRSQTGKLMLSSAKRELIDRSVAYHLGVLKREFDSGELQDEDVYNADETHFVNDQHDHKTLSRRGDCEVKYADMVSGDEGMTMMVLIEEGHRSMVHPPFMILKNENRSYPIRNIPDDIPGVCYRTQPKAWMDGKIFLEWINETRVLPLVPPDRKRVLFLDNCSGHTMTDQVLDALRRTTTEVRFFPANATDLIQSADSFVIQKLKTAWRARWDAKKLSMIKQNMWTDPRKASGKLVNPGKTYFLQLARDAVRDVNAQRDKEGLLYSRKAMIRCGLSKNMNGVWEESQLFQNLQEIINRYRENFKGPVDKDMDLEGEKTETDEGEIDEQA